jgi:hypothetical protein
MSAAHAAALRWFVRLFALALIPSVVLVRSAAGDASASNQKPTPGDPGSLAELQAEHDQWLAWLRAPAQASARVASRSKFAGETGPQARATDVASFHGLVNGLGFRSLGHASGVKVLDRIGARAATVEDSNGKRSIVESTLPLYGQTPDGGSSPLDLSLTPQPGSFVPRSTLVPVSVPASSDGELKFRGEGVGVSFAAGVSAPGELAGGNVFYPNVGGEGADTDAVVQALPFGAEISYLLRSEASPQSETLSFHLPAGWYLRAAHDGSGSIEVLSSTGDITALVPPALAVDAQGQTVPTSYAIQNSTQLILTVTHATGDYAYPILVDPAVVNPKADYQYDSVFNDWTQYTHGSHNNFNAVGYAGQFSVWKNLATTTYAGDYAAYKRSAPSGAFIYELDESGVGQAYTPAALTNEFGGIEVYNSSTVDPTWENGTWQNVTGGTNPVAPAGRYAGGGFSGREYLYCARVNCTSGAASGIHAGNYALFGLKDTANGDGSQSTPEDQVADASVWLSDAQVPTFSNDPSQPANHSGYTPGTWTTGVNASGQTLTDTVTSTAAVTTGLGMSSETIDNGNQVLASGNTPCPNPTVTSANPPPNPCNLSYTANLTYSLSALPEGDTALNVKATNAGGNHANSTSWHVLIDRTTPNVTLNCPGAGSWSAAGSTTCTISGPDPAAPNGSPGSGIGKLEYRTQSAGGSWTAWTTGAQFTINTPGRTYVQARTTDNAGNVSTTASAIVELGQTTTITYGYDANGRLSSVTGP